MGIVQQNTTLLSLIRREILTENSAIFKFGNNDLMDKYNSPAVDASLALSMTGSKVEFIDEGSNTVAIGVPLSEIKIKDFNGGSAGYYKESDVKLVIRSDFMNVNKSDTHVIMFRIKFGKSIIEKLYDTNMATVKRETVSDIYNYQEIASIFHMNKTRFPFRRYINVLINTDMLI